MKRYELIIKTESKNRVSQIARIVINQTFRDLGSILNPKVNEIDDKVIIARFALADERNFVRILNSINRKIDVDEIQVCVLR